MSTNNFSFNNNLSDQLKNVIVLWLFGFHTMKNKQLFQCVIKMHCFDKIWYSLSLSSILNNEEIFYFLWNMNKFAFHHRNCFEQNGYVLQIIRFYFLCVTNDSRCKLLLKRFGLAFFICYTYRVYRCMLNRALVRYSKYLFTMMNKSPYWNDSHISFFFVSSKNFSSFFNQYVDFICVSLSIFSLEYSLCTQWRKKINQKYSFVCR